MSFGKANSTPEPLFVQYLLGATSSGGAAAFTHPLDLLKVRQQVTAKGEKSINTVSLGVQICKNEGIGGLYKGLSASLARQFTYSGARIGSYPFIKQMMQAPNGSLSLERKIAAGMLAGAVGAVVGNPADLINVRMQADSKLPIELRRNYRSVFHGAYLIVKNEGVTTLWQGSKPNVIRAMFMTASQLASYDQIKELLLNTPYFKDDLLTHFTAGSLAGVIATIVCSPVDVVKTRLMNDTKKEFSGFIDCGIKTMKNDGPMGFFKGFGPSLMRLVPQTILTFVFYEQVEKLYQMIKTKTQQKPVVTTSVATQKV